MNISINSLLVIITAFFIFTACVESNGSSDQALAEGKTSGELHFPQEKVFSAGESNPENFKWMQGFPPSPEKRLSAADGSFFSLSCSALECNAYAGIPANHKCFK